MKNQIKPRSTCQGVSTIDTNTKTERPVREGRAEAAAQMHIAGDDRLLLSEPINEFGPVAWTW